MKQLLQYTHYFFLLFGLTMTYGQELPITQKEQTLSFEEFLGYVKQHHPLVKQAHIKLSMGEAKRLKARGGFDPKIEVDFDRKKLKGIEYYDQLNATFKIPTWYGIEFKANFEQNSGEFLNPNLTVPDDGLYSAGVSFSLAQGLLINERMATLKKAKHYLNQAKAERILLSNEVLYNASIAYFDWLNTVNALRIYKDYAANAQVRFEGIQRNVLAGEKAEIDAVEAKITLDNRLLNVEKATLKQQKATLNISNYLWINDIPMELQDGIVPEAPKLETLVASLQLEEALQGNTIFANHPKVQKIEHKIKALKVDRALKRNKLLPRIDLQYNFLNTTYEQLNTFEAANYKAALTVKMPLFLRKERGDLKLAGLKLQQSNLELLSTSLALQNKIEMAYAEINTLARQYTLIQSIVQNYRKMVNAEERKFTVGESSLFLVNSREKNLINTQLKANTIAVQQLQATANLFKVMGVSLMTIE